MNDSSKPGYYPEFLKELIKNIAEMDHNITEVSRINIQMISIRAQLVIIRGNAGINSICQNIICKRMIELNLKELDDTKVQEIANLEFRDEMNEDDKLMIMEKCNSIYDQIKSYYIDLLTSILELIK